MTLTPARLSLDVCCCAVQIIFKRRRSESDSFRVYLPSDAAVHNLYARDAINLRVAMVDASRGKVMRRFGGGGGGGGGAAAAGDDSSDSDSDHSSDQDELSSLDDSSSGSESRSGSDSDDSIDDGRHLMTAGANRRRRGPTVGGAVAVAVDDSSVRRVGGLSMAHLHSELEQMEYEAARAEDEQREEDDEEEEDEEAAEEEEEEEDEEEEDEDELLLDVDSLSSGEVQALHRYGRPY